MRKLYPKIKFNTAYNLAVDSVHELYIEECGNPKGMPVVFIHGGPGSGCEQYHRRFFDPEKYRIILFDQRGCGKSTPHSEIKNNSTQDLVSDLEAIRELLNVSQWILFGGSWGSTLSLVYAQTHPERVLGMILRGIFLCRQREIDWFYQEGANRLFPDVWQYFIKPIPENERDNMVKAYHKRLSSDNDIERVNAAKSWSLWEGRTVNLIQKTSVLDHFANMHTSISLARIECHYFMNNCFLSDNQILDNMDKISHIPAIIVQGRYDVICPTESAYSLHQAWKMSELEIIPDAGHSASEPGIIDALIKATHTMLLRIADINK